MATVLECLKTQDAITYRHVLQMVEKKLNTELNKVDEKLQEHVEKYLTVRWTNPPNLEMLNVTALQYPSVNLDHPGEDAEQYGKAVCKDILTDPAWFNKRLADILLFDPSRQCDVSAAAKKVLEIHAKIRDKNQIEAQNRELRSVPVYPGPIVLRGHKRPDIVVSPGVTGAVTIGEIYATIKQKTNITYLFCFGHKDFAGLMPIIEYYYDVGDYPFLGERAESEVLVTKNESSDDDEHENLNEETESDEENEPTGDLDEENPDFCNSHG